VTPRTPQIHRVGAVSYLNARPLVDGLELRHDIELVQDVPSRLLDRLLAGEVHVALCPVIDYQTSPEPLAIVPSGAIGSDGPTFTVRLYSRDPFEEVDSILVDGDSHTSVVLLRILLSRRHGIRPSIVRDGLPRRPDDWAGLPPGRRAILMIGDKVVATAPPDGLFPHQMDLGAAWKELTGLPFVFATWLTRRVTPLGGLPGLLSGTLRTNLERTAELASLHASSAGWPEDLARTYLADTLTYHLGHRELEAVRLFWRLAREEGLVSGERPLVLRGDPA